MTRLTLFLLALMAPFLAIGVSPATPIIATTEIAYADWRDAHHAVATLEARSLDRIDGLGLEQWRQHLERARQRFLVTPPPSHLSPTDRRAWELMHQDVAQSDGTATSLSGAIDRNEGCDRASAVDAQDRLVRALYDCFVTLGNHLTFEEQTLTRTSVLELLHELPQTSRREEAFRSFTPLWQAINGDDSPSSPYRRLLRATVEAKGVDGDRIDAAARTVGTDRTTVKRWLTTALESWSNATIATDIEPWDYWFEHARATQDLDPDLSPAALEPLASRFFHDLGADLGEMMVVQDLQPRAGKAPLAYTDYIRIGRKTPSGWRPARVRVSANIEKGGLYVANELIHEQGHAIHMMALRTRPAFFDLGEAVFYEAFADVPSWSVAAPAFQSRYIGKTIDPRSSSEALFAGVMLDVAWGLFELEMLDNPSADPNLIWTNITHRYLHIKPHPEIPWWALRVQLVHAPGYMINYALGAIITADLRERIGHAIGPFDGGNRQWYRWTSRHLLRSGQTEETADLLRHFLGRPVSVDALLQALAAIKPPAPTPTASAR